MRLQIVGGQAVILTCIKCQDKVSSDTAYADLDGEPYKAYYCPDCATENARQELDRTFDGQFMQPQIGYDTWAVIETENGIYFVSITDCGSPSAWNYSTVNFGICLANVASYYGDYVPSGEDSISEISYREGYGARLSASGYMDCTEWTVYDTEMEAIEFLIEMYGDIG